MADEDKKSRPIIVGADSNDADDLPLESAAELWRMIEERRRGPLISLSELKTRLKPKPSRSRPA